MASADDQLAANINFSVFSKATELKRRIWFALGALIVGFFCVRLTGIYFAMLSLAFGELLFYIVFSWYSFTKGDDGIHTRSRFF